MAIIIGYVDGVVANVNDPKKMGRAKINIPGILMPTPYWCNPIGWPGGGGAKRGSRYLVECEQQVVVFFERGNTDAGASFLPGMSGAAGGVPAGPQWQAALGDPNTRATLWEDEELVVAVACGHENTVGATKYIVMGHKGTRGGPGRSLTGISIAVNSGPGRKSHVVSVQGRTAVVLKSDGAVKIEAPVVTINGRRVMNKGGSI
jgi:hypothetical protein